MNHIKSILLAATASIAFFNGCGAMAATSNDDLMRELNAMKLRLNSLERRLTTQEDVEKIRMIAFSYGYFMDNGLYDQVKALLSPTIESCEISGYGLFKGLQGCKRVWGEVMGYQYGGDKNRVNFGWLVKHYLLKDVIVVAPDGKTATGRFDYLGYGGRFGQPNTAGNQMGIYSMNFVKEDGIWRIGKFRLTFDTINYNEGDWVMNPRMRCPNPQAQADAPSTHHHPFPETAITPFNFKHPVTGKEIPEWIGETHYWIGTWPGDDPKSCGKVRTDAPKQADAVPTRQ